MRTKKTACFQQLTSQLTKKAQKKRDQLRRCWNDRRPTHGRKKIKKECFLHSYWCSPELLHGPRILLGPCLQRVHAAAVAMAAPIGHSGGSEGILELSSHIIDTSSLQPAALTQVLWCQKTWLETTGNTFCQVGRMRVGKDDESFIVICLRFIYLFLAPGISEG